jgi:hypothetical protein
MKKVLQLYIYYNYIYDYTFKPVELYGEVGFGAVSKDLRIIHTFHPWRYYNGVRSTVHRINDFVEQWHSLS